MIKSLGFVRYNCTWIEEEDTGDSLIITDANDDNGDVFAIAGIAAGGAGMTLIAISVVITIVIMCCCGMICFCCINRAQTKAKMQRKFDFKNKVDKIDEVVEKELQYLPDISDAEE